MKSFRLHSYTEFSLKVSTMFISSLWPSSLILWPSSLILWLSSLILWPSSSCLQNVITCTVRLYSLLIKNIQLWTKNDVIRLPLNFQCQWRHYIITDTTEVGTSQLCILNYWMNASTVPEWVETVAPVKLSVIFSLVVNPFVTEILYHFCPTIFLRVYQFWSIYLNICRIVTFTGKTPEF